MNVLIIIIVKSLAKQIAKDTNVGYEKFTDKFFLMKYAHYIRLNVRMMYCIAGEFYGYCV